MYECTGKLSQILKFMSDKEKDNPLEELQKQLKEALKKSSFVFPFPRQENVKEGQEKHEEVAPGIDAPATENETLRRIQDFNLKPREIRDYLNRFVVKQEEAKKVLAVSICDHFNHVRQCIENKTLLEQEYTKQNILLLGPTGVGKTYLMRNIAKLIGVPFVKADATKFSETGYVGADVEDLVRDLVKAANGNIELAQYGIIYIDEIDKIASEGGAQKDVSGRGVQINLLKLMEETEVNLFSPTDMMAQMQAMMDLSAGGKRGKKKSINTRHILFIVSGAFDKLAEQVKKRVDRAEIGFGREQLSGAENMDRYLKEASTADFIKYGFEPEFIGRLPVRVSCESLNKSDLSRILSSSEGSILKQYHLDFRGYGINFDITDEAIEEVAGQAALEKTGARGLLTVLERIFRSFKFELPSTAITHFEVSTETIANAEGSLKKLLIDNQHLQKDVLRADLKRFAEDFKKAFNLGIEFDEGAMDVLMEISIEEDKTIRAICEERFKDFQHGLQIISRNTGKMSFTITELVVRNPDASLSDWVVASFREQEGQNKNADIPKPEL